jgi:hypothetical protein
VKAAVEQIFNSVIPDVTVSVLMVGFLLSGAHCAFDT